MKELLRSLPDGAIDFGNGVIGPSSLDIRRANSTLPSENLRAQETTTNDNADIILVSSESNLGRFFKRVFRRVPQRLMLPVGAVLSLVAVGCSGGVGEKNNNQELENKASSGYSLPFPIGETWFLTAGPHGDGYSNGIKYAIDIAPPEGGFCPPDGRKFTIDNRIVTASASGEVTVKGDDKNRNDPHHSEIRIKGKDGLTQVYIHIDNTRVKKGTQVNQGDPLGNPSCEYPPGGANTGPHVHIGIMKDGQPISIDGVKIGGWTIHDGVGGKEGTMTKPGEKTRTANTGRYGGNSTDIRNDLPNNPNKAVVAGPKDPISPISGSIKEELVEQGWIIHTSPNFPYKINYPSDWFVQNISVFGQKNDIFWGPKIVDSDIQTNVIIQTPKLDVQMTAEEYAANTFNALRQLYPNTMLVPENDSRMGPLARIKINGKKVYLIYSTGGLYSKKYHEFHVIFSLDGKIWTANLEIPIPENQDQLKKANQQVVNFQKMLESIKKR